MVLKHLRAERLRNLRGIDVELPPGLTLVVGPNGQGKTSLLEALYLLATGRSFRTRRLDELVAWNGGPLRVSGKVSRRAGDADLAVTVEGRERTLLVNGAPRGQEAYLGRLDVIDLTGPRMDILRGAPVERRRFLDRGVVGLAPSHLRVLGGFRRALQHRNALLRRGQSAPGLVAQLDAWDEPLVAAAERLHLARRDYAERLAAAVEAIAPEWLPAGQPLRLGYRPSPPLLAEGPTDRVAAVLAERLGVSRGRDLEQGHTTEGPHRDELVVELDGVDLRRFGSAGQVRAAVVALKLGKLSLLGAERGEPPLFLMDDFDTDLDDTRMGRLAGFLGREGGQAVVATSKESWLGRLEPAGLNLRMEDGAAWSA
jgi:DNA replication and repair protein RecF